MIIRHMWAKPFVHLLPSIFVNKESSCIPRFSKWKYQETSKCGFRLFPRVTEKKSILPSPGDLFRKQVRSVFSWFVISIPHTIVVVKWNFENRFRKLEKLIWVRFGTWAPKPRHCKLRTNLIHKTWVVNMDNLPSKDFFEIRTITTIFRDLKDFSRWNESRTDTPLPVFGLI